MKQETVYSNRILKVRKRLQKLKADVFFCTTSANVYYLSGFLGLSPEEREATLLITKDNVFLYVARMYQQQATQLQSVKEKVLELKIKTERDGLMYFFKKDISPQSRVIIESANITLEEFYSLSEGTTISIQGYAGFVEELRIQKDLFEKEIIKTVVKKTDKVFEEIVAYLRNVDYSILTELDVADTLLRCGRKHGLKEFSFDPIVAVGTGSSEPHYKTGFQKLSNGNILLMDFGFKLEGYCSDLTRTIFLGKANKKQKEMYKIVLDCNTVALENCNVGMNAGELHIQAINFFNKYKLSEYFIHGLGHGIGLDVHEEPYFRPGREHELKEGMVVTIEPGLYFPGKFGVRIEDYVIMGKRKGEVLSQCSKDIIEI